MLSYNFLKLVVFP